MQKAAKTTSATLAARRTVLLRNRFVRLVSTCRQNRSFVTRRTKPGNSGRLPPSAAVQGRSSGRAASSRGGGGAECSECYGEWRSQRALLGSRAPQLRLQAGPPSGVGGVGREACRACRGFEAGDSSGQLFPVRLAAGQQRDQCRTC